MDLRPKASRLYLDFVVHTWIILETTNVSLHRNDVKRLLGSYTKEKGLAGMESGFLTYSSTWGTNPDQETIKKTVVEIGTDYIFLIPTQAALYLHANAT